MRRRDFLIGAAATVSPRWAFAQSRSGAAASPLIGILALNAKVGNDARIQDFVGGLAQFGYVDGKTATIVRRYAEFEIPRLPSLAAELAALRPDVIMADTASAIKAARDAAPTVPIIGASMSYPIEQGLIASFAHPGGNTTGMASQLDGMSGKALELALEVVKDVKTAGFLMNTASTMGSLERRDLEAAAKRSGIRLQVAEARRPDEIDGAIAALATAGASFVILQANTVFTGAPDRVARLAIAANLPTVTISQTVNMVQAGIMLSYGVDIPEVYRRTASFVDRILKGAKASELPIEFPTRLLFAVNLRTAKALGITVPQSILLRADEVIE
ncbi:MAG TPA: ABC transporter substrate-binding protein [Stellaceae bacterium]|nr:ABC transporter substrate-binding protein [Stellaceae bacterium]